MAKSKEELIELLKSNIKAFNSYRKEARLDKLDFSGSDLSVANLCRADLSNTILRNCDLSFSYLHSANLSSADLTDLTLGRADMTEVNLSNAILDNANLSNTILYGANLSGASAKCIILEGSKIRESNLSEADMYGSNFTNLDLSGVNFNKTNLKGANFSGSNLSNAVNLQQALFDEDTIWPADDKLPKDFIPGAHQSTFDQDENDYQINSDFGTGVYSENTDFEFLDFPGHKDNEEELNMQNTVTEIGYENKKSSKQEEPDLPVFDDFPELPDLDSFDETDDLQDDDDEDAPPAIEDDDSLHEVFNLSLKQISENEPTTSSIISSSSNSNSSITQQNFSVKPTEIASNMAPTMGITSYSEQYQQPVTTYDPHVNEKLDSIMTILGNLVDKLEVIENEQKDQREYINNIKINLQQEQKEHLTNLEHTIEQEHKTAIELIKKSQEEDRKTITDILQGSFKNEHKNFLSDIKEAVDANQIKELVSEKVDFISHITKTNVDRLESKIDIIAQTDPLDQMDAMISELSESIHSEQENLEVKINELTTISESVVSLLEMISFNPNDKIDLTSVSSSIHDMLSNLESNVRQDQDKLDQKIDDLSVMLDNMNHTIFDINAQVKNTDESILLKSINIEMQQLNQDIFDLNDLSNNINTTLGALVDLSNPAEVLEAISNSKSEIVTKNAELEEKLNGIQNNIELSLQKEFSKSAEAIHLLNDDFKVAFDKYNSIQELLESAKVQLTTIESKTDALGSDSFMNLSELITALTEKIELQINDIEQNSKKVIDLFEDSIKKANQSFNDNLVNIQNTVKTEFIGINQKIEQIISNDDISNQKIQVLKQIVEDVFEKETTTNNNVLLSNQKIEYLKDLMNGDYETSKVNFIQLNKKLEEIDTSLEKMANEPQIDDEIRSIFEHLLYLSEKNSKAGKDSVNYLIQKMEANELAIQNSLHNLDKRISKVNSIVRNVYKSLDGITDLITGEGSGNFRLPKLSNDFSEDAPVHSRKYDRRVDASLDD